MKAKVTEDVEVDIRGHLCGVKKNQIMLILNMIIFQMIMEDLFF